MGDYFTENNSNLFLFTASGPEAKEHYEKTIKQPVSWNLFEKHAPNLIENLKEKIEGDDIYAWGATPGERNTPLWEDMDGGDYVLFYRKKRLKDLFRIVGKTHNKAFARELWGEKERENKSNDLFEYMYFLEPVDRFDVKSPRQFRGHTRISDKERMWEALPEKTREKLEGTEINGEMGDVWQISPGRKKKKLWQGCTENNVIAIGWGVSNLSGIGKEEIANELEKDVNSWTVKSCDKFAHVISKGDIIVAKKGSSREAYGLGVVEQEYFWDKQLAEKIFPKHPNFCHFIGVNWVLDFVEEIGKRIELENLKKAFSQWTVHEYDKYYEDLKAKILEKHPEFEEELNELERKSRELFSSDKTPEPKISEKKKLEPVEKLALAHLIAGKNVIFSGPPGTGKTRACKKIAEKCCKEYTLVTAHGEWTNYDVVGGPQIEADYRDGFLTKAADKEEEPHWVIIDEINRANLDLAFGEAFTLLDIDYREESHLVDEEERERGAVNLPESFRILATMNSYDKAILNKLGYAFRRRFAFIEKPSPYSEKNVLNPDERYSLNDGVWKEYSELNTLMGFETEEVEKWKDELKVSENPILEEIEEVEEFPSFNIEKVWEELREENKYPYNLLHVLINIAKRITEIDIVKLGHAQVNSAYRFVLSYLALNHPNSRGDLVRAVDEAVTSYYVPQFELILSDIRKENIGITEEEEDEIKSPRKRLEKIASEFEKLGLEKSKDKVEGLKEEETFT